jgi:hypothetical protein
MRLGYRESVNQLVFRFVLRLAAAAGYYNIHLPISALMGLCPISAKASELTKKARSPAQHLSFGMVPVIFTPDDCGRFTENN